MVGYFWLILLFSLIVTSCSRRDNYERTIRQQRTTSFHLDDEFDRGTINYQPLPESDLQHMNRLAEMANQDIASLSVSQSDLIALQDLYNACNGKFWTWYGYGIPWAFDTSLPSGNPCSSGWEGVMCNCNYSKPMIVADFAYYSYYDDAITTNYTQGTVCKILKLYLNDHNLSGPGCSIPSSFGNLQHLTHLHLANNSIKGPIDTILSLHGNVVNTTSVLEIVQLAANSFNGTIPASIGSLLAIQYLNLAKNCMTGTLPIQMYSLPNLRYLSLTDNNFPPTTISTLIGNLNQMRYLSLTNCSLVGSIPTALGSMKKLRILFLNGNQIIGTIPNTMTALKQLQLLDISDNMLSGQLPSILSSLTSVAIVYLQLNSFVGQLSSAAVAGLTNLQYLSLQHNSFSSTIPTLFLESCGNLASLDLSSNFLTGSLPSIWGTFSELQELYLNNNSFVGSLPGSLGSLSSLKYLALTDNQFSGSISSAAFNNFDGWQLLESIDLSRNLLTGSLPVEVFTNLPSLKAFAASENCFLIRSFTPAMCEAKNLTSFVFGGVKTAATCVGDRLFEFILFGYTYTPLTYSLEEMQEFHFTYYFPQCLLTLPLIETLHVAGNGLYGNFSSITESNPIGPNLNSLVLSHNFLTGTIPSSIQERTTWITLDLSFNELSGTLSSDFQLIPGCELVLSVNRLSGAIPAGIIDLTSVDILEGNYFDCPISFVTVGLPIHDDYSSKYVCGSNSFYLALIIWCSLFFACSVVLLVFICWIRQKLNAQGPKIPSSSLLKKRESTTVAVSDSIRLSDDFGLDSSIVEVARNAIYSNSELPFRRRGVFTGDHDGDFHPDDQSEITMDTMNSKGEALFVGRYSTTSASSHFSKTHFIPVLLFEKSIQAIRQSTLWTVGAISCLLLVYGCLHVQYSNVSYSYAYTVSASHLSGLVPGIILSLLYLAITIGCHKMFQGQYDFIIQSSSKVVELYKAESKLEKESTRWMWTWQSAVPGSATEETTSRFGTCLKNGAWKEAALINLKIALTAIFNIIVVSLVNILYILAYLNPVISRTDLFLISITLSIFKLSWTRLVVPNLVSLTAVFKDSNNRSSKSTALRKLNYDVKSLTFNVIITVFNTILIPCFAILVVSPDCLFYVFTQPAAVNTSYQQPVCSTFNIVVVNSSAQVSCIGDAFNTETVSFIPPYGYTYSCSYSLLASYAPVFVYMFLITAFISPPILIMLQLLVQKLTPGSLAFRIVVRILPPYYLSSQYLDERLGKEGNVEMRKTVYRSELEQQNATIRLSDILYSDGHVVNPILDNTSKMDQDIVSNSAEPTSNGSTNDGDNEEYSDQPIFNAPMFVLQLSQLLCVVVSFGVIFPPLAIMGLFSIYSRSYVVQFMIRRLTSNIEANTEHSYSSVYKRRINDDCTNVVILLRKCLWFVFPFGYLLIQFFIFDIFGGEFPGNVAFAAVIPCVFLMVGFLALFFLDWINPIQLLSYIKRKLSGCVRH